MRLSLGVALSTVVFAGCLEVAGGSESTDADAGRAVAHDAGSLDGSVVADAGVGGGGDADAGGRDAGGSDAGRDGSQDAGGTDAGSTDAGKPDAGSRDAGGQGGGDAGGGERDGGPGGGASGSVPGFIAKLADNTVYEIPDSTPTAVFPDFPDLFGSPTAAIYAWSGGAYDPKRQHYLVWGGGHNDYNGNEVYAFPLYGSESPKWFLLTKPSPPTMATPTSPSVAENPDGTPASNHTYALLQVDPFADRLVSMGLGSVFGSNGAEADQIRALNLATNTWEPASTHPSVSFGCVGSATAFDPLTKRIYRKAGNSRLGLDVYDVATRTLTTLSDDLSTTSIDFNIDLDPERGVMLAIGGYDSNGPTNNGHQLTVWKTKAATSTSVPAASLTPANFPSALRSTKLGLAFHPPSGSFVAYASDGTLFRIVPPPDPFSPTGWVFERLSPQGPALPADGDHGTYSRWRWAPYPDDASKGVFVVIQAGAVTPFPPTNVFIFKPGF